MIDRSKLPLKGNTLKIIACVTMLIDHIGAVILPQMTILRIIGRIAMPIYCYMIATGARYTRNRPKYIMRMSIFMLVAEIPFDMAFGGKLFDWTYQSVMVTLTLGLCAALASEFLKEKLASKMYIVPSLFVFAAAGAIAQIAEADYGFLGVFMIAVFYYFYKHPIPMAIGLAFGVTVVMAIQHHKTNLTLEVYALMALLPIFLHNGKKGSDSKTLKYGFYAFYPVHLLILGLINILILH